MLKGEQSTVVTPMDEEAASILRSELALVWRTTFAARSQAGFCVEECAAAANGAVAEFSRAFPVERRVEVVQPTAAKDRGSDPALADLLTAMRHSMREPESLMDMDDNEEFTMLINARTMKLRR